MLTIEKIHKAKQKLNKVVKHTALEYNERLSNKFQCRLYIKREDQQSVRSYKIRGAYNLISSLSKKEQKKGVVCASAGNHAQGFAFACKALKVQGTVFMPTPTPLQKINKVKFFGGEYIKIVISGDTFDDASKQAIDYQKKHNSIFVHPFDDIKTITGQATIGIEILSDLKETDIIICPIGGGGVISGIGFYAKNINKNIKIFGCDPKGAPKTNYAKKYNKPTILKTIDTFIDGAAVKKIGEITFEYIQKYVDQIVEVPEGKVCTTMIELYQNEGIIAEPAGALTIASLEQIRQEIKDKIVVCLLSGGNNDISRYPEIIERSLVYEGLKHYYILELTQKPGQLKRFLENVLTKDDDITRFEYIKKTNKEKGSVLIGIEVSNPSNVKLIEQNMNDLGFRYNKITENDLIWQLVV